MVGILDAAGHWTFALAVEWLDSRADVYAGCPAHGISRQANRDCREPARARPDWYSSWAAIQPYYHCSPARVLADTDPTGSHSAGQSIYSMRCFDSTMKPETTHETIGRRRFLTLLAGAASFVFAGNFERLRAQSQSEHPEPRPGIDAARVLAADKVPVDVAPTFDKVRQIPHVVDGIRCYCGCADVPGMHSLLSCYEDAGMAAHCEICQGEGKLVYELHKEGRSLKEIRAAIDRRFRDHH
jgi:hypothetical protein